MAFVLRVAAADLSGSDNPALYETLGLDGVNTRIPTLGLQLLYLFEDAVAGDAYSGTVPDLSGNGYTGSRVLSSAPTGRSYGIEVTDVDGLVLATGLRFPKSFTAIGVMKNTLGATTGFPHWFDHSGENWPASDKTDSYQVTAPVPMVENNTSNPAVHNKHAIFQSPVVQVPAGSTVVNEAASSDQWNVMAYCSDGVAGTVELSNVGGATTGVITDADLIGYWDTFYNASRTVRLGWIPFQTVRPANAGQLAAFAIYDRVLTGATKLAALRAIAARVAARGVTIHGYVA